MPRQDEDIKRDVVDQLAWDSRVDASRIEVKVENGQVQLEGTVPLFSQVTVAKEDALAIAGVSEVKNRFHAGLPPEITAPSDMDLQDNAETILGLSPDIEAGGIRITVEQGKVIMEGVVASAWQKNHAENAVAGLRGVRWIENRLSVVPSGDLEDQIIAEEITRAMKRNPLIDVDRITVRVNQGFVTLTGTVPSGNAMRSAAQTALYTTGVRDVTNELVVLSTV